MLVTILAALILLPQQARADPATPHVTAVVVARAKILEGVRVGPAPLAPDARPERRGNPIPQPRERPCPEGEATPCRLMVIDMP